MRIIIHVLFVLITLIPVIHAEEETYSEDLFNLGYGKCEYLITELHVNYVKSEILSTIISCKNKNIFVLRDDLKYWNVNPDYFNDAITQIDNQDYVNIQKLDQINHELDTYSLVLDLKFPPKAMRLQTLSSPKSKGDKKISGTAMSGVYLNYDYSLMSTDKSRVLTGNHEVTYFTKGSGVLINKFLLQKDLNSRNKGTDKLVRLDSYWNIDRAGDVASFRIGDNVTKGANWSSSARFAGVQYATNFQLNPDLITHSLMNFSDTAVVPTTIDIYTEQHSILKKR